MSGLGVVERCLFGHQNKQNILKQRMLSNCTSSHSVFRPKSMKFSRAWSLAHVLTLVVVICFTCNGKCWVAGCEDSTTWAVTLPNGEEKFCSWANIKPNKRCGRRGNTIADNRLASEACPLACGTCRETPRPCQDRSSWIWTSKKGRQQGCAWVAQKSYRRCQFLGSDSKTGLNTWAYVGCPEVCGRCPAKYSYDNNVPDNQSCSVQGSLVGPRIETSVASLATRKLSFYAMGDSPYDANVGEVPYEGEEYACLRDTVFPRLAEDDPQFDGRYADFIVHVGDIWKGNAKGGVAYCKSPMFQSRQSLFQVLEPHLDFFAVPGDNEWNECANFDGSNNPSPNSTEELWRKFFASSATSPFANFDRQTILPASHVPPPTVHRNNLQHYPELFFFSYMNVAFFGILSPMNHAALDANSMYDPYNGDINAHWIDKKLATFSSPPTAIVIFGHSRFSDEVRSVLIAQGSVPILYVKGNAHPKVFCLKYDEAFPHSNLIELTVQPFKSGPLLVSIAVDHFGGHFFQVEGTNGC